MRTRRSFRHTHLRQQLTRHLDDQLHPIASLLGVLIGMSAILLMASHGRIAGISGIASRLFPPYEDNGLAERLAFILGLMAAPFMVRIFGGSVVTQTISGNLVLMVGAGWPSFRPC
jgi:uncharacterized protein